MTIQQHLAQLVAGDRYMADATVTFGPDFQRVEGGIIRKSTATGLVVLNLAPISLDQVGGFGDAG